RVAGELIEVRGGRGNSGYSLAQLRSDFVENRDADEKLPHRLRQSVEQRLDEIALDVAAARRQRFRRRVQVVFTLDGRRSQLQPDRPALGDLVQSHAIVQT